MNEALRLSYARAERATAESARSFHFASRFLPEEKRRAIFALYDYCRHADNLVDARGDRPVAVVRADLARLAEEVRAIHAGGTASERWLALADTLHRFPVPEAPLLALLEGVAMDLDPVIVEDWPQLERYCYLVAGVVGLMLGPVLGAEPDRGTGPGIGLGIAMQLTNICRDVGEDLDRGRVYFPARELAEFGLSREALERREVTPAFRRFMAFQVARARRLFNEGDVVVPLFPDDGSRFTIRLLQRTYAGILGAIERNDYDVFRRRAYVGTTGKVLIVGREWARHQWSRLMPAAVS
ncbi:MAG TPA: squalene/phytoene synthase family protein [Gemmatimonadales bacterium]